MNIVCVICADLLIPSDEIVNLMVCGHIFHYRCLKEWRERSETCPQCRQYLPRDMINKIHLSFSDSGIVETLTSLRNENSDLILKLELRDKDINILTEIKDKLEKQAVDLKHEVSCKDITIYKLKDRIKFCRKCLKTFMFKKH